MSKTEPLTIRVTKSQRKELENEAQKNGFGSINSYILSRIFPNATTNNHRSLTHQEILNRLQNYAPGTLISIPDLFTEDEWKLFDNTVSIGRTFRIAVKNPNSSVAQAVDFVEKRSGYSAVYKVK